MQKFNGNLRAICWAVAICCLSRSAIAAEPAANTWVKQEQALIGPDSPIALVWSPPTERFMSLGWISSMYNRRAPYTYDELAFDAESGQWENWFPQGKNWGPRFGVCQPPGWKGRELFTDAEGNVRPNWPDYYWLTGAPTNCTYLPKQGVFLFYIDGHTFSYDPQKRLWKDLAPLSDPQNSTPLKTRLFWGSICYDAAREQVVLFGGGNSDTQRGDPGTWIYTPANNTWRDCQLDVQPPPRANSQLVYDPVRQKVILFGGDQLDQTIADTWAFDGSHWTQKSPAVSPSPRAGHALLWLPQAKRVLLLGGYTVNSTTEYSSHPYRSLPMEAWTYDEQTDAWQFLRVFETNPETPVSPRFRNLKAAVSENDQIALVDTQRQLWLGRVDASTPDAAGTAKLGKPKGAVERRSGVYDPAWYREEVPAADPAQVKTELSALPENKWVLRPTPKRPGPNMDWGSSVFAPELDMILRFSGGHSAYSGTAPQVYDVKTDRYSIPFAPEFPIDWCFSNDQVPGEYSFQGNPWMTGHTYKSTGYDPRLKSLVFAPHNYTYFFDPLKGKWTRNDQPSPFQPNFYTVTLVTTPTGVVAWAYTRKGEVGLWRLDAERRSWQPLEIKGKLFGPRVDNSGVAYDAKREQLLFFIRGEQGGCHMASYNFSTGEAADIAAAGAENVAESGERKTNFREAIYLTKDDLVMIGATGLVYDIEQNAWFKTELASDDPPFTKEGSYNIGVMFDPHRQLVWGVNTNSQVFVLKFHRASAKLQAIK